MTVILDTNVVIEALSAEFLKFTKGPVDELLRDRTVRYRQLRTRYSLITLWHLAESGVRGLFLHEELRLKSPQVVPPAPDPGPVESNTAPVEVEASTYFTHVIANHLVRGFGRLEGLPGSERSNAADNRLVSLAVEHNASLVTNEGVSDTGINARKSNGEKTVRVSARKAGVPVFAPVEYITAHELDHEALSSTFLAAVPDLLLTPRADGARALSPQAVEDLHGVYRFILFDDLEPPRSSFPSPRIPWELPLSRHRG